MHEAPRSEMVRHPELHQSLIQSYRSTLEIIEFANRILPFTDTALPPAQPVFRSVEPVKIIQLNGVTEQVSCLSKLIQENQDRGMRTIAIIGRTAEDCSQIYEQLTQSGMEVSLISQGQSEYRGGISIVPVFLSKGLEFDAVMLMDVDSKRYTTSPQDAKLLYVGCTRALHSLTILYQGEASPLID